MKNCDIKQEMKQLRTIRTAAESLVCIAEERYGYHSLEVYEQIREQAENALYEMIEALSSAKNDKHGKDDEDE